MENIVVYKSARKIGYRPQVFKEWTVGTKLTCNGEQCEVIAVLPNDRLGIARANQMMKDSDIHQHNLAVRRQIAAARREADAAFATAFLNGFPFKF
ncbi:MAG: hypothetical protein K6G25_06475 [Bacteroidales bacterium]|nr:hypothetical protein [Bacteroidales bacterium]